MPAPTKKDIQQSWEKLQKGLPLPQTDFSHITRAFASQADPDLFLGQIRSLDQKLAETLVIFRNKFAEAAGSDQDKERIADQAFLHYIINTDGRGPQPEDAGPFDVLEAASRYAESIGVSIVKEADGALFWQMDEKKEPLPEGSLRKLGRLLNKARYGRRDIIPPQAFGFDERVQGHTLANAMTLADFSLLAYFGPAFVEKQMRLWGYVSFVWIEDEKTDTQAFVAGKDGHLIVCFRGTSSGTDALVDARFFKTDAFGGCGRVHRGFQGALDSVWHKLNSAVLDLVLAKDIFVCGHSLGAALAQLAAHRFALNGYPVGGVYVYGSPRVGNRDFMDAYNELLEEKTFLHINHKDIVAQIPPRILGFNHLGGSPRLFDEGHAIRLIPKSRNIFEAEEIEMEFEELDQSTQAAILQEMKAAQQCLQADAQLGDTPLEATGEPTARGMLEIAPVNDHSMDEYLFKFGCAIVDGQLQALPSNPPHNFIL